MYREWAEAGNLRDVWREQATVRQARAFSNISSISVNLFASYKTSFKTVNGSIYVVRSSILRVEVANIECSVFATVP